MAMFFKKEKILGQGSKTDVTKWVGWILALAMLVGVVAYAVHIRAQLWFTVRQPEAITACIEGYQGEHSEADRRFEMKQKGEILSPLSEEDLKALSQ